MNASSMSDGSAKPLRPRPRPDLTSAPLAPTILFFMLPVLGRNIIQSLNASANFFWVSYVLGESALSAIANANQVMFLMLSLGFGISIASSMMIGQVAGAKDPARISHVVGSCTVFFLVFSIVTGVIGHVLTPAILDLLATPLESRDQAISYLRIIFIAMPFMYFFSYLMAAQGGFGDSRTPFFFALTQVLLDLVLNPMLIMGVGPFPELGIAGSALATLIAQALALAAMLVYIYCKSSPLVPRRENLAQLMPDFGVVKVLVCKGTPIGLQMIVGSFASAVMISAVNRYGSVTTSAYGAVMQLSNYVQMPAIAASAAISAVAAQNIGAGRMDRVKQATWIGVGYSVGFTLALILLILVAERLILQIFLPANSPALPIAAHMNEIVLWSFIGTGFALMILGPVRAAGAVWPPLFFLIVAMFGIRIPFAFGFLPDIGADAIWYSYPIGAGALLLFSLLYYQFGKWRTPSLFGTPR